jgi:glycerol-3-phosphate dehydrogenase
VYKRQALLHDARGLVEPQSFAFADYKGRKPGRWLFALGLALYDLMQGKRSRHYFGVDQFNQLAPHLAQQDLQGGLCYQDAKTDDARLVLRVLQEARSHGALAINYLPAKNVLKDANGKVCGALLLDAFSGQEIQVKAKVVLSATGAWADALRPTAQAERQQKIRPLRGSHLIFPAWRLPVAQAVSLMHPQDGRPVFVFPWEGVSLVGTTDVDHGQNLSQEAAITKQEADYLMAALHFQFPTLQLHLRDATASYAGVRPVVDTGAQDPSKEGRDHVVWQENGMLTVTGGKLTTFRAIALDALHHVQALMPDWHADLTPQAIFAATPEIAWGRQLLDGQRERLQGRYGRYANALLEHCAANEWGSVVGSDYLWAEIRWMARAEAVQKLEDLMLRRSRLGLLLKDGGRAELPRIAQICRQELGWDAARWAQEEAQYLALWQSNYSVPN